MILYNVDTSESKILLGPDKQEYSEGVKFDLSPDGKNLLIAREYKKLFRSSFSSIYDILNLETNEIKPLTVKGTQQHLLLAEWNPTSNGIVFNYLYNLYYKKSPDEPEIQLTFDGHQTLYNGVPDWVYEEEVLSSNSAMWLSPNGKWLAFIKFNDTQVPFVDIPIYGPPGSINFQYTLSRFVHYPKAGAPNPIITLQLIDLEVLEVGRKFDIVQVVPPTEVTDEHIISTVAWANNENIVTVWMNRIQNKAVIQRCQIDKCENIALLESRTGWIELFTQPLFNAEGTQLAILASQAQDNAGGFRHLTMIPVIENGKQLALTDGKYVVTEMLKWNPESNIIFYTANLENDSESKHLYAIKGESGAKPQCLTCGLISGYSKAVQHYFETDFSKFGKFFILTMKGPDLPEDYLYTWKEQNGKVVLELKGLWEGNDHLKEIVKEKETPMTEFHEIQFSNYSVKVMLQVPRNIDRSGKIKYPMLVDVYGGPDSFSVIRKFSLDWGSHLAANRSIIYARIDGRGSGLRGDRLLHQIYLRLGTVEIEDQLITAR